MIFLKKLKEIGKRQRKTTIGLKYYFRKPSIKKLVIVPLDTVVKTKPNNKTLNTLAKFVGYKNYIHFSQITNKKLILIIIYKIVSGNFSENENSEDFISMIIILIREL